MRQRTRTKKNSAPRVTRVPWVVVEVRPLPDYRLFVRFADGTQGEVAMSAMLLSDRAGVFERLRDTTQFAAVYIDGDAVAWAGDLDLAPDAMYDEIRANGRWTIPPFGTD